MSKIVSITHNEPLAMQGKTIVAIQGMTPESDEVLFTFSDGQKLKMYHWQDCCESVYLADVNGNIEDLLNTPLLVAESRTEGGRDGDWDVYEYTFYTFRTIKGSVDLRWIGTSNGYYATGVEIEEVK